MDATTVIREIADSLGVAVSDLTSAYGPYLLGTRVAIVAISAFVLIAGIIATAIAAVRVTRWHKRHDPDYICGAPESMWIPMILGGIAIFIGALVLACALPELIGTLMSPSGAVVADIMQKIANAG